MDEQVMYVTFNPTSFQEFENAYMRDKQNITYEVLFGSLCWPGVEHAIDDIYSRMKELDKEETHINVVIAEKEILGRFIWPLRQAKVSFMLGNFLSTIALCGFIGEMIVSFIYEVSNITINKTKISPDEEKVLFGDQFTKLHSQERSIRILHLLKFIDDDFKEKCLFINSSRNKHIHTYYEEHDKIQNYAKRVYTATTYITSKIIGQDIRGNELILKKHMIEYLKSKKTEGAE